MERSTRRLAIACLPVMLLAPGLARAQTITASGQINPTRSITVNGVQQVAPLRPVNLNPTGINYSDCLGDMTLQFNVEVSGFNGSVTLEVWASNQGDCTAKATRGFGSVPTCWQVSPGIAGLVSSSTMTEPLNIKVRDIVGPQNAIPNPAGFAQTEAHGELLGTAACATQPSFLAVPMYIWFLAIDGSGASVGTPFEYGAAATNTPFTVDLVGPPAPTGVSEAAGDTLLIANWTANIDTDTVGYDLFIDPMPGQEEASAATGTSSQVLYCPDSGSNGTGEAGQGGTDSGDDGSVDATTTSGSSGADAGCFYINAGGPVSTPNSTCGDSVLSAGFVEDSGTTPVQVVDEAGNLIDAGASSGLGGISNIPCANLLGGCSTNLTISSNTASSYTISGLTNGVKYTVVLAAVDGSGNIGPPSAEICDYPAPVIDFWSTYRAAGGRAGGGFCALETVGAPGISSVTMITLSAASLAFWRRRKKR